MSASFLPRWLSGDRPIVMGVVNVTPDSFSDGSRHVTVAAAVQHGCRLAAEGAAILDIGGESTRPGAESVAEQQELDRVMPVIEGLRQQTDLPISIDTSKPAVMRAAVSAGAAMINDVCALREQGSLQAAGELGVVVCLMHMQGQPRTMQAEPTYTDVVAEVVGFLRDRAAVAVAAGVPGERLIVDPGFGFGKTVAHNLELLRGLEEVAALGYPVLAGLSRKSMLAKLTGRPVDERLAGSIALGILAAQHGVSILRVHDVAPTVDALRVLAAFRD